MALTLDTNWQSVQPLDWEAARARLRGGAYNDATVDHILALFDRHARDLGFALAPSIAQVAHETNNFRYGGQVKAHQWNFAGIGATNDGSVGVSWEGPESGVMAFYAHHGNYRHGAFTNWPAAWEPYKAYATRNKQVLALTINGQHVAGTIQTIGNMVNGVWAWSPGVPLGSLDNGYARAIVRIGNELLLEGTMDLSLTIREAIIPASNANRPGRKLWGGKPAFVTVHETSNYAPGADAEMHRKFVANGGGEHGVSFHWVVDDKEAIHLIPDDEVAWHAGDGANGPGNNSSVAIETCVNADGDWSRTRRNLAVLTATLCHRHGLDPILLRVVQHNRWSGKNCPLVIRKDGLWAGQLAATEVAYRALTQPAQGGIYAAHTAKWQGGIYASNSALWG